MANLMLNEKIARGIFNDTAFREELIEALQELIDEELLKNDENIDFETIDAYTGALNELYDETDIAKVFWKLQTAEEFVGSKKGKVIYKTFKAAMVACAVLTVMVTADYVTRTVTGEGVAERVAQAVREFLNEEKTLISDETSTTLSGGQTVVIPETTTDYYESETTVRETETETQTSAFIPSRAVNETATRGITPQNPNLTEVLSPEAPSTEKQTETTTREPFTRVDEDKTASPIVIKLTPQYSSNFKRSYKVGENADFDGLTVTAVYDNGTQRQIPISKCNVYGFSTETAANRIVTVEYEGCSFSYLIRVEEAK